MALATVSCRAAKSRRRASRYLFEPSAGDFASNRLILSCSRNVIIADIGSEMPFADRIRITLLMDSQSPL